MPIFTADSGLDFNALVTLHTGCRASFHKSGGKPVRDLVVSRHDRGRVRRPAVIPIALAFAVFKADPSACYDSPCALPLLLVTTPPFLAPVLAVVFAINRRREKPFPDGWLPTLLTVGILAQAGISAFSILSASPVMRRIYPWDLLFIPNGFVSGVAVAAVCWVCLYALARWSTRAPGMKSRSRTLEKR